MRWLLLFLLSLAAFTPAVLLAQEEADGTQRGIAVSPSEEEAEAPAPEQAPLDRTAVLPAVDTSASGSDLVDLPSVYVSRIELDGAGLLGPELFEQLTAPYLGREVSFEELTALKNQLSMAYFDRGHVNSGVELPDQKVTDGTIVFHEVRGRLTGIELSGNHALNNDYWLSRLATAEHGPLQINTLQESLQLIEQGPVVKRIEAKLLPGVRAGESHLQLAVEEHRPWNIRLGFDNYRSPSLGGEQLVLEASHLSLTGRGDVAELNASYADGFGDFGISYRIPVNARETAFRFNYSQGDAEIVEAPFSVIDIRSKTRTAGLGFDHPFKRNLNGSLAGFTGIEALHSETTLLGVPFSFSLGEINGEADATALVAGLEWVRRSANEFLIVRLSARKGLDWFDGRVNPYVPEGLNGPETRYLSFRGQMQYVRRLEWRDSELQLRGSFQLAQDPLLPVEKMPVGGARSVRGFRENLLVRDNALVASIEWRIPLFERTPLEKPDFDSRAVSLALFSDFGQSWDENTGLPSDAKERISSIGLGLLWNPSDRFSGELYYGHAVNDFSGTGDDLQDRGWHFHMGYAF